MGGATPGDGRRGSDGGGSRLVDVVFEQLAGGGSRSAARRLVLGGAVRVDGRVDRRPGRPVPPSASVVLEPGALAALPDRRGPATAVPLVVVFEDRWLLAVDKPAGVPTHATLDPDRPHLHAMVEALLASRSGPEGGDPPYVGIHHRLDRDTSGVVLFTVDRAANPGLAAVFAQRRIEKRYVALVASGSPPPATWEVRDHLGPVGRRGKTTRYGPVRSGGDPAHSEFRLLGPAGVGRWLVEAIPHTGRTHQLRVHLAGAGRPIVGDDLYGGPPAARMMLHAGSLRFPHPLTGEEIVAEAPLPPGFAASGAGRPEVGTSGRGRRRRALR